MIPVLSLPQNTKGRDFAVGDIHAHFDVLDRALEAVQFDPARDRVISVGDLVDRGPQPLRCLEFLKQPWFFAVRGNHEDGFLKFYRDVSAKTLPPPRSFGAEWILDHDMGVLSAIAESFSRLPFVIEILTAKGLMGVVHADMPFGMDWATFKDQIFKSGPQIAQMSWGKFRTALDQDPHNNAAQTALWSRKRVHTGHEEYISGVERVFFGHTPQTGGPKKLGNAFYIDTGCVYRHDGSSGDDPNCFLTVVEITAPAENIVFPTEKADRQYHIIM